MFIGRTDAEAETPILWPPHAKSWLVGKDCDAGRDWGQEEKGMTEDADSMGMSLSKLREFVMDREAWRGVDSWGRKESDTTEQLNWTELTEEIGFSGLHSCLHFKKLRDFAGGPVIQTSPSEARGVGSIPGRGAEFEHASQLKNQKP